MLHSSDQATEGYRGNAPSETEHNIQQSKNATKKARKKKEGTDGIDAVDEHSDAERLNDGFTDFDEWN